jgi:hypothetical protein
VGYLRTLYQLKLSGRMGRIFKRKEMKMTDGSDRGQFHSAVPVCSSLKLCKVAIPVREIIGLKVECVAGCPECHISCLSHS